MTEHAAHTMRRWAETAEAVRATRKTSEKVALMGAYLRELDDDDLAIAATYFSGRPFPERDQRKVGLGWAAISAAALQVAEQDPGAIGAAYDRSSDLGTAVGELLAEAGHRPDPSASHLTLGDTARTFGSLAGARGNEAKRSLLVGLFERADSLVARYVTAILSGELRIGLREGHLEAGIAAAFGRDLAAVQWAGMLTGDIGQTAVLARHDGLATAVLDLGHPLKPMLASPVADETAVFERMTPPVWVEDKYDGIRAQLHKDGATVHLYSRDLNDITGQFPEVVRAAATQPWDGILDGELLAWKDGAVLPFLQLQSRLGRKAPSDAIQAQVPVIYVAFDVLALGSGSAGETVVPLLRRSLRQRRSRLEALSLPTAPGFGLAALVDVSDAAELERVFDRAQARGNEGLMIKDPDSIYQPGRRGYAWLKLKKALTTLDCVVIGVEVGHGRRHGVLSDYTFAVLDDRPDAPEGKLVTIGKAYSGLTDAEIAEMTRWFEAHTVSIHGRYRVVEPMVVVEIAFDVIHRSNRHASGFALRFPRIVRIRDDKGPGEIDRLSTVASLHERLEHGGRYRVLTTGEDHPAR
jgi:DNA ligase-1